MTNDTQNIITYSRGITITKCTNQVNKYVNLERMLFIYVATYNNIIYVSI